MDFFFIFRQISLQNPILFSKIVTFFLHPKFKQFRMRWPFSARAKRASCSLRRNKHNRRLDRYILHPTRRYRKPKVIWFFRSTWRRPGALFFEARFWCMVFAWIRRGRYIRYQNPASYKKPKCALENLRVQQRFRVAAARAASANWCSFEFYAAVCIGCVPLAHRRRISRFTMEGQRFWRIRGRNFDFSFVCRWGRWRSQRFRIATEVEEKCNMFLRSNKNFDEQNVSSVEQKFSFFFCPNLDFN